MKSIKTISGDILLYLYKIQRDEAFRASYGILRFGEQKNHEVVLIDDTRLSKSILEICKKLPSDAYNALSYLEDKYFITFNRKNYMGGVLIHNIAVTANGVDIIEGIEREEEGRRDFTVMFNIKLADTINVESLIKNELGSILKAALL